MQLQHLSRACLATLLGIALAGGVRAQSRLANLSTRGEVSAGAGVMITGLAVGGGSGDTVLIRAVGPGLAQFGLSGLLSNPVLTLYDSSGNVIAANTGWGNAPAAGSSPVQVTPQAATSAIFSEVSAFGLQAGSADSAMVVTLPSGIYTAQVSPASGSGSGIALLEVYEVNPGPTSSPLVNLSTRLFVGQGATSETSGFVVNGSGTRTLLIRGVGPSLANYGVTGLLPDPAIVLMDAHGNTVASNDNWGTPVGSNAANAAALSAAFAASGAFPLTSALDSALIAQVPAGASYTVNLTGNAGGTGEGLLEIYDITPTGPTDVSIAATQASADTSGNDNGAFTISRTGDTSQALTVNYMVGGSATPDVDYPSLPGFVTIPAGATSATVTVAPYPTLSTTATDVILTLSAGSGYGISGSGTATVNITPVAGTLYVASLRPATGATDSTASGTATIVINPADNEAMVNLAFSNLTSTEVVAHLVIGAPGTGTDIDLTIPYGQAMDLPWNLAPSGPYSTAAIVQALQSGQLSVEIDSAEYPTGELLGTFNQSSGSQTFVAPPAPPSIDLTQIAQTDAARFLTQATFGPTMNDITTLMSEGYDQWLSNQMALPETSHLAATRADAAAFPNTGQYPIVQANREAAWWNIAVTAPDQLRQRVAFALSEIFVVSDQASSLAQQPEALANYYDLLANDAFGNFRQLLQDVTLSPVMGNYLDMLRSAAANPAKGTSADENYAREVQQLFTIGLNELNPDGTLQLDANGLPIPTYDQAEIVQTSNVFTGWAYNSTASNPSFNGSPADWYDPMMLYPAEHDNTQKTIVNGIIVPANEGGAADLKVELDALFNHQNTGPFLARGLIQRLVTSNPSPGYVYRVAQVFANDGTGVRGNLAAVIKAVLLDYEARSPVVAANAGFGKLKEPLLRETALFRAFDASASDGRFGIFNTSGTSGTASLGQTPLDSPTVFNFFLPDFVEPGPMAQAGLYSPEMQITTASSAIMQANYLYNSIYTAATPSASTIVLNLSPLTSASSNAAMVSTINLLLCAGSLNANDQQIILNGLAGLPTTAQPLDRARYALDLIATDQMGAVQQ